jgi:hypothetical protein
MNKWTNKLADRFVMKGPLTIYITAVMMIGLACRNAEQPPTDAQMISYLESYLKQSRSGPADAEGVKFLLELKRQQLLKK